MAIDLATGFNIGSKDAIDERQVLTLEQMKNLDESIYPDKYFAICKDNGKLYLYNVNNIVSEISGKFRVLEGNVIGSDTVVDGAKYYTLEEVDLSYYFLLAKINFGDKTSFSGKMTFMFNHKLNDYYGSTVYTEKKEIYFNHKEGNKFNYVMLGFPIVDGTAPNAIKTPYFDKMYFRGILTENNEFYLFLYRMLNQENCIHNFYIEYIGDGSIEETFVFDDVATNPRNMYNWSASKWFTEEGMREDTLISPSYIDLADKKEVVLKGLESTVYSKLSEIGRDSSATFSSVMYNLYPSQALFCDVTGFSNYQTMFPYEEEADAESRVYILCIKQNTNYYLRWERKDGTKQAVCYVSDMTEPVVWNMIVGGSGSTEGVKTYTSLEELNKAKGTSISLVNGEDNTQKILDVLEPTESFITWFHNNTTSNRFGIDTKMYGDKIHKLKITKDESPDNIGMVVAYTKNGQVLNRYYANNVLGAWSSSSDAVDIIANTANYKITLKRRNTNWYGFARVEFVCSNHIYAIDLSITASEKKPVVVYSVNPTLNVVDSVTYDGDTTSETFSIGIKLKVTSYGTHKLIVPNGWADIILFSENEYIGATTAKAEPSVMGYITNPLEIGLTEPTTAMAIYKAMPKYTTFIHGTYNTTSITGLPDANGLLEITKGGGDGSRGAMTFTQSAGNTAGYKKKWVGEFKANNTDTSDSAVIWHQLAFQTESTAKEDGYIPDMYDRNANGDIPVVPFDRLANHIAIRQNEGLVSTTETDSTYDEDYVGGYAFMGANDILVKNKEMFNKIKVLVHVPGVLRIGIVNDKILEANPRYSTCLVKWLVTDFVAFTGMKEYDIDDTVLEEGQSIFLECRVGVSSWYLNTGEATQVGAVTYPANSCTTGLNVADKLDTTTNNALFKSQKVNSSSCLTSFGNNMYGIGGNMKNNFATRKYNSAKSSSKEAIENLEYFGGLNVGLYRRTKYSDTRVCKCIENGMNNSWVGDNTVTKIYASLGQEKIVGKSVYAFKLDVRTPGNLTIYHLKGKSLDTVQVIDKYTHYVRARGLQTIHLPFDIKLNSTDEYIGFGGLHCKSTSDNIVRHSCCWHYLDVSQATWMNTIDNSSKRFYSIGISNTVYPEKFTSFETNTNYLNIEIICRGEKRSPLEDKYISFTGDSITTFAGFCTTKTGYPEGNPAGDNAVYYPTAGKVVNNVDATWWGILARDNRMKILRNDAWSGSRVSSSEGSTDTKCLCGTKRRYYLRNGYTLETKSTYPFGRPEIIVSMIGTNDLSGNVELGQAMFSGITGAEEEYKTILSAFSLFCRRLHAEEGNGGAKIVHFLIPRGSDYGYANASGVTIAELSLHFERIAKAWGQYFIPLSYFNGIKPNAPKRWSCPNGSVFKNTSSAEFSSADGLHPNAMGMEAIADGVHRFLCSIM